MLSFSRTTPDQPTVRAGRGRDVVVVVGHGTLSHDGRVASDSLAEATAGLRRAGARFAFLHGSHAEGRAGPGSDLDVAGWWGGEAPPPWEVDLPPGVDLLVLDRAPLELAGRVALRGQLLFDDDPPARVGWQARTRLQYLDEEGRQRALDRLFFRSTAGG